LASAAERPSSAAAVPGLAQGREQPNEGRGRLQRLGNDDNEEKIFYGADRLLTFEAI
jgi:hypothetical protein